MQFFFNSIELCKTNEKLRITERFKKNLLGSLHYHRILFLFYFLSDNCSEQQRHILSHYIGRYN